ncbi:MULTISPECIES: MliC family protein [Chryseobacterium]|uniref:MliC family protein n=1 Tax=Chryseobacterium TaxID=59732 RepID=UPI0015562F8B|nr:MliC family protein [Chryseobacterium sp. LAM-KRS1]WBV58510.1 MliC family protein [Chryseobacterium daecheongense]
MKRSIFATAAIAALFLTSCNKEKTPADTATTATVDTISSKPSDSAAVSAGKDEIVKSTSTDSSGKTLEMTFNNTKNTATVVFNKETIELQGQKPASGIWYKNDHYELRGKGEEIELTKDGKVVFKK